MSPTLVKQMMELKKKAADVQLSLTLRPQNKKRLPTWTQLIITLTSKNKDLNTSKLIIQQLLNLIKIQSTYISLMVFVYSSARQNPAINDITEEMLRNPCHCGDLCSSMQFKQVYLLAVLVNSPA